MKWKRYKISYNFPTLSPHLSVSIVCTCSILPIFLSVVIKEFQRKARSVQNCRRERKFEWKWNSSRRFLFVLPKSYPIVWVCHSTEKRTEKFVISTWESSMWSLFEFFKLFSCIHSESKFHPFIALLKQRELGKMGWKWSSQILANPSSFFKLKFN